MLQLRRIQLLSGRVVFNPSRSIFYSAIVRDTKHFFTNKDKDATHFFTKPNKRAEQEPQELGNIIQKMRTKRRINAFLGISGLLLSILIGYKIGYKVIYLQEESYIPLAPCFRVHKLTDSEKKKIRIQQLESFIYERVIEELSGHDFIKEHYGVPIRIDNSNEKNRNVKVWGEDEDPVIMGLLFAPDLKKTHSGKHNWYRLPKLFEFRLCHKSINIRDTIETFMENIGFKYDKIISPTVSYDTFKYEYPIHGDEENDRHSMHICFMGEFKLDDNSTVVYKGKYHVDVKFDEINLLRKEGDQLVKYVLLKEK